MDEDRYYGTGLEGFMSGRVKVVDPRGRAIAAILQKILDMPFEENNQWYGRDLREAYDQINRSAVASLGFDPRNLAMSMFRNISPAGAYSPDTDTMFANEASTVTHESTHRGMKQLRDADSNAEKNLRTVLKHASKGKWDEEIAVRMMMKRLGDLEPDREIPGRLLEARNRALDIPMLQKLLDDLEKEAAALIARRRPGGPR